LKKFLIPVGPAKTKITLAIKLITNPINTGIFSL
jgi:hypothetical protein